MSSNVLCSSTALREVPELTSEHGVSGDIISARLEIIQQLMTDMNFFYKALAHRINIEPPHSIVEHRDFIHEGCRVIELKPRSVRRRVAVKGKEDVFIGSLNFFGCTAGAVKGQMGDKIIFEFTHNLPKNPLPIETIKSSVNEFRRDAIEVTQVAIHEHMDDPMWGDQVADFIGVPRELVVVDLKFTESQNGSIRHDFRSDVVISPRGMIIHFPLKDAMQSDRFIIWGESSIFDANGSVITVPRSKEAK